MITETTLTLGTTTTLDYLGVDDDIISTTATTVSTTLTIASPINIHHYYHYANSYVESLSDLELAQLEKLVDEKIMNNETVKQLKLK